MNAHSDLTWDELDRLVDADTLKLRDVAWAEITWLRAQLAHERGQLAAQRKAGK